MKHPPRHPDHGCIPSSPARRAQGAPPPATDPEFDLDEEIALALGIEFAVIDHADVDDLAPEGTGNDDIDWSSWDFDVD